jgi:hypothetical protein
MTTTAPQPISLQAKELVTAWQPQQGPQEAAIRASFVDEIFYGGAAGGGKSDFLLGDYLMDIDQGGNWQGILFRQSYPALDDLVHRSSEIFPRTGGEYKVGASQWEWPNGARLRFRHMETIFDFVKYQGHSFQWIGFDELPEWADMQCWNRMKSRLRGPALNKRMRGTGNPGGVGHGAVKTYFNIPSHPTTYKDSQPFVDSETQMTRMFIPSRVQDNKILMDGDPNYIHRLAGVGDPELVRAWLDGDWSALVGAYFSRNWSKVECIDSFEIPRGWPTFTGLDYGETSPSACLWGAVDYDKNLILYNEYYEVADSATAHARDIMARQKDYPYCSTSPTFNIADPNFFVRRKISEAMVNQASRQFQEHGMSLRPGNNNRVNGWRILNDAMSKGKLKIFKEWAPDIIRTLPQLPRDLRKPEDINTESEDHLADALRYMAVHVFGPGHIRSQDEEAEGARVIKSLKEDVNVGRYS